MLNRIASVIGWIGTVLVFGSVAVRLFRPEWNQYAYYGAWAGLACVLLYMASQWRDVADSFSRRQTRLGTIAGTTVIVVLALLIAVNYLASRRNKRWDLTANQQFSLSDQTRQILQKLDAPIKVRVFDQPAQFDRFRDRLNEYAYVSRQVSVDYIDMDKQTGRGDQEPGAGLRHGGLRLQGPHRAGGLVRRAAAHQRPDQGDLGQAAQGVLRPGSRREGHDQQRAHRLQHAS